MNSKTIIEFIAQQWSRGIDVTPELRQFGVDLAIQEMAVKKYKNRDFWCKIGLHSRVQAWYGGGYPQTCVKCWRHFL